VRAELSRLAEAARFVDRVCDVYLRAADTGGSPRAQHRAAPRGREVPPPTGPEESAEQEYRKILLLKPDTSSDRFAQDIFRSSGSRWDECHAAGRRTAGTADALPPTRTPREMLELASIHEQHLDARRAVDALERLIASWIRKKSPPTIRRRRPTRARRSRRLGAAVRPL